MQPELATPHRQGVVAAARQLPNRLAGAATDLARRLHLPTTFTKFLIVGAAGFVINSVFLYIFYDSPLVWFFPEQDTSVDFGLFTHTDIRLLIASVLAVEIAIVCQFNLHERWTFRERQRRGLMVVRFLKFNVSSAVSPIIIVATTNVLTPVLRSFQDSGPVYALSPYMSNALGVLLGFSWNWALTTLVVWPHHKTETQGLPPGRSGPR